ncbi:recombinase family protein [Saccharibacillus qingshengii]|uniref:recombinase family protein n=1 Tax=Saccharibacillus qingshengii TaxID=1763540 RepID=UPI001553C4D0|nr:recombinase family protein [Saccharibacillus qingshengii]
MNIALYLRVSSEQQAERQLSIPAQREALRKYALNKGWNIVEEFVDEAKSAKTDERPSFQEMIAAAQGNNANFQAILVHKFDRFSRSRADHVIYKALLKKQGIQVLSVTEQTDPDTPHGMLLEGILEVISEFYNLNLKQETLKGMRENAAQGYHCGGRAPFGYRLVREGSKVSYGLGPQEEIDLVKQIFSMASEGMGGKKIARILNAQGIPKGRRWAPSTVLSILQNEAYLGQRVWNKKSEVGGYKNAKEEWIISKGCHPAIINEDIWVICQEKINARRPGM